MRALSRSARCWVIAAGLFPQPPGHRQPGQAVGTPMCGQPVEETVGRRVVALPGGADDPGHRRKHHERRQIQVLGQLVQVPGPVDFGPQHRIHPLRRQRRDQPIVERARGVEHTLAADTAGGNLRDQRRHRIAVGHIAGHHRHLRPGVFQLAHQLRDTLGVGAAAAGQHHMRHPVTGHQMSGQRRTGHPGAPGDDHAGSGQPARPAAPSPGPSGRVSTTLPIWRAWLTNRYAAEAHRTSKVLTGNGSNTPAPNISINSASIAAVRSGPASIRSNARYSHPG